MNRELFGTDGIRGPAGTYPLNHAGMLQIGKAVGSCFTQPGDTIMVGWDPRESSGTLLGPLVEGLVAMGVAVKKVGVIPTPGLAYVTKYRQAKAGVMITASHNLYTDNGVKVFTGDGNKLPDDMQAALNKLIVGRIEDRSPGTASDDPEAIQAYEDFLVSSAEGVTFKKLSLAIDTANGATSGIAARVFERLGAQVTPLFDKPDGRNINVACGATDTAVLRKAVVAHGLDSGVAFDGDGDRVIIVDAKGRELTGDHLLYILAIAGGEPGVVATIMSNKGLETTLKQHGIAFTRTAVGDRSVLAGMQKTGFQLGGEQSGHIIISQYANTGDGLLAAIRALRSVVPSGRGLADWRDELQLLPQALVSVPFPDKALLERNEIQGFIKSETAKLRNGRLSIRASGTEPKVRIMVEAPDAEKTARIISQDLLTLVQQTETAHE